MTGLRARKPQKQERKILNSLVRNILGGILIMGAATLVGIAQNSTRSQPLALIPRVQPGPNGVSGNTADGLAAVDLSTSSAAMGKGLISTEEVKNSLDNPAIFIIDARADKAFNDGHISGALNVPYDRFTDFYDFLLATIPMEATTVICYCWSPTCDFSDQLAQELRFMGYTNVLIYREGWDAWQEAGYSVEP